MHKAEIKIGSQNLVLETGKIAKQANGAVTARYGETVVLATACCGSEITSGLDYVPLLVDYNERYYSAGKIPGGFIKRETRPKDKEILVSRLIDRPMRPLFEKSFGRDIQVIPMTISTDQIHTPDIVGMIAAFASVMVSDIPFNGPLAAVRVGLVDGKLMINPTFSQIQLSSLDIIVAGNQDGIMMVEGGGKQISESLILDALSEAESGISRLCEFLDDFARTVGKEKLPLAEGLEPLSFEDELKEVATPMLEEVTFLSDKISRSSGFQQVVQELRERYKEKIADQGGKRNFRFPGETSLITFSDNASKHP